MAARHSAESSTPRSSGAQHSGDRKLDRAVEKANAEFIVAMKTGDAATIAAPYVEHTYPKNP